MNVELPFCIAEISNQKCHKRKDHHFLKKGILYIIKEGEDALRPDDSLKKGSSSIEVFLSTTFRGRIL